MSLIAKQTVSLSCIGTSFTWTETTGAYDASSNPGGYGSPNPEVGECSGVLVISNESSDVTYDDITITLSDSNAVTVIELADILLDGTAITEIADGVWKFLFTITDGSENTYTSEVKILVIKDINCSVVELAKKYSDDSCGCCNNKDFRDYLLTAYAKWLALTMSPICGDVNKIDTQRESLEDYLEEINCKNC